jgi:uncharacterized repeat protein (TIGR03806 family)
MSLRRLPIKSLLILLAGALLFSLPSATDPARFDAGAYPRRLSEWGLFEGPLKDQRPMPGVWPYTVRSELFSDYAWKRRFVRLPDGGPVIWQGEASLDFPVGTVLVKTFDYPHDFRYPERGRRLIETRLLVREDRGWVPLTYVYDARGEDAILALAGDEQDVAWLDHQGRRQKVRYVVPTQNQCKGCHLRNNQVHPVGTTVRMLHGGDTTSLLDQWVSTGILQDTPPRDTWSGLAVWNDPSTGDLDQRARAYLDANCGHCHRPEGAANTSGLFLHHLVSDPALLGVYKSPVAAGKGSGGHRFNIHPGKPGNSILLHRMTTNDPGARMPEFGRSVVHQEGVALIQEWIAQFPGK